MPAVQYRSIQQFPSKLVAVPSEHVFVKYFDRRRGIGDTQAKSGHIELFYVPGYMLGCEVVLVC